MEGDLFMNKKALLVGINYPGTDHALRGCVNDVMLMSDLLTRYYGFKPQHKRMLTDASATTANILERLNWLVDGAQPGDVLYFHYSGHGSQVVDAKYDSDEEPDGMDEIICPIDLDWRNNIIRDEDMRRIFDRVPEGVNLTVVLDCCHSGDGIDSGYAYQPFGKAADSNHVDPMKGINISRKLDMPADIANRGMGLDLKPRTRGIQNSAGSTIGLMISGCQSHQTSADSYIGNKFMGAATFFLARNVEIAKLDISYKTLVDKMNEELQQFGYTQRPELNGDPTLFDHKFLAPFK
jgi:hypothetical protein